VTSVSVFLDTNIVVYLIERTPDIGPIAAKRVQSLISNGQRLGSFPDIAMEILS
jgi:predicted nucleic acid-binding protein